MTLVDFGAAYFHPKCAMKKYHSHLIKVTGWLVNVPIMAWFQLLPKCIYVHTPKIFSIMFMFPIMYLCSYSQIYFIDFNSTIREEISNQTSSVNDFSIGLIYL